MNGYTTKEVAELVGLNTDQVRHYVRRKLILPARGLRGEYLFSFQDVVLVKTAKGLLNASVSTRKAYRALEKLKQQLEQAKSLSAMRIYADGSTVVVRDKRQTWEVETGQAKFDFSEVSRADVVAGIAKIAEKHVRDLLVTHQLTGQDLDANEWYNLGLNLEEVDPENAPRAYQEAIRLDPKNADAQVNLGRLYQLNGDLERAKQHYELALETRSEHQLAFYNLGTLYDELDQIDRAMEYYTLASAVPDAHYNLARILELRGDEVSALRHLMQYPELRGAQPDENT